MLEGVDYAEGNYEKPYVLDFDMSWHKNSSEKDIVFESRDDFGYLAPEQTDPARAISTRSTKVDSYGLAMTAFALFGGQHPMAGWSMSADWEGRVNSAVRTGGGSLWKCLELRVARAIVDASRVDQERRLDFNILLLRFSKIASAAAGEETDQSIDLIAEEILCSISNGRRYVWDDVADRGWLEIYGGIKLEISADESHNNININLIYVDQGSNNFRAQKQYIGETKEMMDNFYSRFETSNRRANLNHGMLNYAVSVRSQNSLAFVRSVSHGLSEPIERLLKIQ